MNVDEILNYFAKQIENELGIVYSSHNYFQLQNRLDQIAALRKVDSIEALYHEAKLGMGPEFKAMLMDIATNNETSFFRDPRIFKAVETSVLNTMSGSLPGEFRVWSAASSSGQEALSIAIMLMEWLEKRVTKFPFHITGSDISGRILSKAKEGRYSELEIARGLPEALRIKYFEKEGENSWRAKDALRSKMDFKRLNLKEPFHFEKTFDLVFCRNVLIYQSVAAKKDILSRVTAALSPHGFLVLGAGESLYGLSDSFDQVEADGSVIYRKKNKLNLCA